MTATDTAIGGLVTWDELGERDRQTAITALYDAHVRDVYRYVHRLCLDHATAEDVTQDVFVAALRAADPGITIAWLLRSARNRLIDIVRREANYRDKLRVLQRTADGSGVDEMAAVVDDLRLRAALAAMRPEHRIVLLLHYIEGTPVAELAGALGRSYKGAEGLLSRARAALRAELERDR